MTNNNVKLSAPWIGYYREINELFGADPNVRVEYDNANVTLKLYVNEQEKADAISHLLPTEKAFGNVILKINIIPANLEKKMTKIDYLEKAFKGNPNFSYVWTAPIEVTQTNPLSYCVFKNQVTQYFNDNLADPHGNVSTLLEIIARDVFGEGDGVFYCTDKPENSSMAVG